MVDQNETYELHAVKYATMQERTRGDNFITPDGHEDAGMPIDYFVWAAPNKALAGIDARLDVDAL